MQRDFAAVFPDTIAAQLSLRAVTHVANVREVSQLAVDKCLEAARLAWLRLAWLRLVRLAWLRLFWASITAELSFQLVPLFSDLV